jgi:hypothetical protein
MSISSKIDSAILRINLALAEHHNVAGVPVWHSVTSTSDETAELGKVVDAIELIRDLEPHRFARIKRDLAGVWISWISGVGDYLETLKVCRLDGSYLRRPATTAERVAATIVHEATHARLLACGFRYEEVIRPRIERVCLRAEIDFASRLPDGSDVIAVAERLMLRLNEAWTDEALQAAEAQQLRKLRLPRWLIRWLVMRRRHAA